MLTFLRNVSCPKLRIGGVTTPDDKISKCDLSKSHIMTLSRCLLKDWPCHWANQGSFWAFAYFLSQLQRLRPLGYRAPLQQKFVKDYFRHQRKLFENTLAYLWSFHVSHAVVDFGLRKVVVGHRGPEKQKNASIKKRPSLAEWLEKNQTKLWLRRSRFESQQSEGVAGW